MLRPDRLTGIVAVDREALTVTAHAGTPLKVLNAELERSACRCTTWATSPSRPWPARSPPAPTAPAGRAAGLAAQLVGFQLVTGTGELLPRPRRRTPTCSSSPASASEPSGS